MPEINGRNVRVQKVQLERAFYQRQAAALRVGRGADDVIPVLP